jgi:hypothetical protein
VKDLKGFCVHGLECRLALSLIQVAIKEREAVKPSPKQIEKFEVEWRVLLHNDDVHTFTYVTQKLIEVSRKLGRVPWTDWEPVDSVQSVLASSQRL